MKIYMHLIELGDQDWESFLEEMCIWTNEHMSRDAEQPKMELSVIRGCNLLFANASEEFALNFKLTHCTRGTILLVDD